MDVILYLTTAIFIATFILIALGGIPHVKIRKDLAALIGGALILLFGIVPLSKLGDYINYEVLLLLFGMMLLVASLEFCGFFKILVDHLMTRNMTKIKFLAYVMVITAFLSAIMLNDAVVLLFAPVVIRCCRELKANPIPYLIATFVSSNIGSVATAIGNPQNAYIVSVTDIGFVEFSAMLLPIALISLVIAFVIIYLICRNRLDDVTSSSVKAIDEDRSIDRYRLYAVLTLTVLTFAMFTISGILDIELWMIALVSGTIAFIIVISKDASNTIWVAKHINWSVLLFFIGLFILMGGVVESGLLGEIASLFPGFGPGETPTVEGVTAFSAVLSNLISNVPSVMLIGEMIPLDDSLLWIALAVSSTLAGNATLIGAASNVIVIEEAEKQGISFNYWKYLIYGLPIAILTLILFPLIW